MCVVRLVTGRSASATGAPLPLLYRSSVLNGSSHRRAASFCSPGESRPLPTKAAGRVLVSFCETSHALLASVNKTSRVWRFNGNALPPSVFCSAIPVLCACAVAYHSDFQRASQEFLGMLVGSRAVAAHANMVTRYSDVVGVKAAMHSSTQPARVWA